MSKPCHCLFVIVTIFFHHLTYRNTKTKKELFQPEASGSIHMYPVISFVTFSFWIKKFPRPHTVYLPVYTHPTISRFSLEKIGLHIVQPYWFYCLVRDWTRLGHWISSKNIRMSHPHDIGFITNLLFSNLESGLKISRFPVEFAGCMWTEAIQYVKRKSCRFKYIWICVDRDSNLGGLMREIFDLFIKYMDHVKRANLQIRVLHVYHLKCVFYPQATIKMLMAKQGNRPLQKCERTGKEYGCFPFAWKTKMLK